MSKLNPVNGNVILRPIENEEETIGNIIIPDMGQELPDIGEVVAVSNIYNFHTGEYIPSFIKKGMKVLLPKIGAQRIKIDNQDYWITNQTSILSILEE
uniref:Co-chaperonin GroES n=1 Tax=uncultured virus TaxID=340016 RepID=A0A221S4D4_9VIRU|nr:co-chaperonin GroES [uncultured virus]